MSAARTPTPWQASSSPGLEVLRFDFNGRRYLAYRKAGFTEITKLSKRVRSNRDGVSFEPLTLKGDAARTVIAAITSAQVQS